MVRYKEEEIFLFIGGRNFCDGGSYIIYWILWVIFGIMFEGWGKIIIFLWMLFYSVLVILGRVNRGFDNFVIFWLDWYFFSSNKLLLFGVMEVFGYDLGLLVVIVCYFLFWSC